MKRLFAGMAVAALALCFTAPAFAIAAPAPVTLATVQAVAPADLVVQVRALSMIQASRPDTVAGRRANSVRLATKDFGCPGGYPVIINGVKVCVRNTV